MKERERARQRETERESVCCVCICVCAGNGSEDRSTGESGRHEGFGDSGHAKAKTSEQVLVKSPWGEELRFFRREEEYGGTEKERERETDVNKPGRK